MDAGGSFEGEEQEMKYSEFKLEVEKLGLFLDKRQHGTEIVDKYGEEYAYVSNEDEMQADTDYGNFTTLPREQREKLFDLLYEIAKTPLSDREEEKRYRVKFPGIKRDGKDIYIMRAYNSDGTQGIDWSPEEYIFNDYPEAYLFTEKEIKSINEYYWHFAEEATE